MTPQETIDACSALSIRLRIAPDGKFTATPLRKVTQELREAIASNRAAIIELIEDRDGTGEELVIEPPPPTEPPKPSIAETIIWKAWNEYSIRIELDRMSQYGMLRVITPFERAGEVPEAAKSQLPAHLHTVRNRTQIPVALGALINNFRSELTMFLRAPFMPEIPPLPADATPARRSIWERMRNPDSLLPGLADNRERVRKLLYGVDTNDVLAERAARRSQELDQVLPLVFKRA